MSTQWISAMKLEQYCAPYAKNSFFIFDNKLQLLSFHIEKEDHVSHFLEKYPKSGENIVEILAQKFLERFRSLAAACLEGSGLSLEYHFKTPGNEDGTLQVIFTPLLLESGRHYFSCMISGNIGYPDQVRLLDQYAHMASHDLRAPITNILSLSNLMHLPEMEQYDRSAIMGILDDINNQAEKLDHIIGVLNKMKYREPELVAYKNDTERRDLNHIMLLDDDALTNKLHDMIISRYYKHKKIVQFDCAKSALQYLRDHTPELILLDLNMPEIDGWSFLNILQEHGIGIDVVIVSSTINPSERVKALSYPQVKDFLTKPLTYDKIKHLLTD